jgi:hypothetical protein
MAAATSTATEWGYHVTGDTGVVTVNAGKVYVKAVAFAGNADNATGAVTSKVAGADVSCFKFKTNGNDLDAAGNYMYFGEKGIAFTGLAVTLSHASDVLYIYVA